MSEADFLALVHFVKDSPSGVRLVRSLQTALKVISALADGGMPMAQLLIRCCHFEYGERMVIELQTRFGQGTGRMEFVDALAHMPASWWHENGIDAHVVLGRMRGHDVLAYLFKHHSQLVTNPENPLYCDGDIELADEYWMHQVRRFIVRGDFRRAWDELQKAYRGVLKATVQRSDFRDEQQYIHECQQPHNRCWRASLNAVGQLSVELHDVMVEERLLTPISEEDRLTDRWGLVRVMAYETKVPSAHRYKPREYAQQIQQPGHAIAICFAESGSVEGARRGTVKLRDEGAAILKIAAYFHALRNARRRLKYEVALNGYEGDKAL